MCYNSYEKNVENVLKNHCPENDEVKAMPIAKANRIKRGAMDKWIMTGFVTYGVLSMGFRFLQVMQGTSLNQLQSDIRETLRQVHTEHQYGIEFEKEVIWNLNASWTAIRALNQKMDTETKRSAIGSNIGLIINNINRDLTDFFFGLQRHEVNEAYLRMFPNITAHRNDPSIDFWTFESCYRTNGITKKRNRNEKGRKFSVPARWLCNII